MKEQLEQRLTELKSEFEAGQKYLADLEQKEANVRQTLLRIQGAIQVIEEELAKTNNDNTESSEISKIEPEIVTNDSSSS
ncbi:MAG: hypothetical protein F6K25_04645 [Okeania sp. SIO2G4]|uniref:hypothetical protein n=1 Tax=unclassified Okeania TaxID=2634635 RepID=UPI0013B95943|nr:MULTISPECIES: hypothetical protein [unclassified Okeania]NEP73983.1 hypothetical protein [Okeania sp. SIO2G5]NEP92615.1 hypothetical protein [Okeania sp. SIO2F5]NEQ90056.1 hypothetical protein [Okeania sp. SIO2G4]